MMRMLHLCADRGISYTGTKGASVHLSSLASAFRSQDVDVQVRTRRALDGTVPGYVEVYAGTEDLDQDQRLQNIDAVYERYTLGAIEGLEFARRLGVPHILEVNSPLVLEAGSYRPDTVNPSDAAMERRLLSESDLVCAVSTPLAEWIRRFRHPDLPVLVTPNGYNPELFKPSMLRPMDRPACDFRLVFVGHPKPWHGADLLPAALREIRNCGFDAMIEIIGGGVMSDDIRFLAAKNGVEDHVLVRGEVSHAEAASRLLGATIGLAPYPRHEFFYFCPIKIIEYLGAGLPIVTTDQGDIRTLAGSAALYAIPGDVNSLASQIMVLLKDPQRRNELAEFARRRAAAFTWDQVASTILAHIRGLQSARRSTT